MLDLFCMEVVQCSPDRAGAKRKDGSEYHKHNPEGHRPAEDCKFAAAGSR